MEMRLPAKVLSLCFLCMLLNLQSYELVHVSKKTCLPNQKLRWFNQNPICCFTLRCHPGQKFAFCAEDQGHDTCQNCPAGYTHADEIDTKDWDRNSIINPCTEADDCSDYSDLTENKQTGQCECDRSRGYFGRDRHKCSIDDGSCKKAGYMLTFDGKCLECDEDHFKTSKGYELCQEKTRCNKEQEFDDPGSPRRDRTCRAKSSIIMSTIKPAITSSNVSNDTRLKSGKENMGDGVNNASTGVDNSLNKDTDELEGPSKNKEKNNNSLTTIIVAVAIVVGLLVVAAITFILYKCYQRRQKKDQKDQGAIYNPFFVCCHWSNAVNLTAKNAIIGDNNKMVNENPEDDGMDEGTPLQNMQLDE